MCQEGRDRARAVIVYAVFQRQRQELRNSCVLGNLRAGMYSLQVMPPARLFRSAPVCPARRVSSSTFAYSDVTLRPLYLRSDAGGDGILIGNDRSGPKTSPRRQKEADRNETLAQAVLPEM